MDDPEAAQERAELLSRMFALIGLADVCFRLIPDIRPTRFAFLEAASRLRWVRDGRSEPNSRSLTESLADPAFKAPINSVWEDAKNR